MSDPTYPLFPIFSFLGFILSLIPLPWHLHAWNSGTCYYMMWASISCLNQFVNSVVWHNNALNPSPVWCEISIRIIMGSTVGLPLSSLCITRRLFYITRSQTVSINYSEKKRAIIIDTILCVFVPLLFIALQYIIQGHRFNVLEDVGCYPAVVNTYPTFVLSYLWPVVIGLISASFCVLSLRAFARRRLEFSQFIRSNNSSLTMSRYFRLMALAVTEIMLTTPLSIFSMWINTTASKPEPYVSWSDVHFNFSRVEQVPAFFWRRNTLSYVGTELTRWVPILCALVFFAFFGFADEAKKNYRKAILLVATRLGLKQRDDKLPFSTPSIGHYVKPKPPVSNSTFTASSLPPYSPQPPSFYPMQDTKKDSYMGVDQATDSAASNYDDASIASIVEHDTNESSKRLTWKSIILPTTSRRYSSYM